MLSKFKIDFKRLKEIDKTMLLSMVSLMIFGIVNIYLASKAEFGTLFLVRQSIWFVVCMVALYFIIAIDYTLLKGYTPIFYWGSILLLIATKFLLGTEINGATGWIRLGPLSFQPSELAKIATIMMLAKKLEDMNGSINEWKNFFIMAFYAAVPALFIVIQPDMGMTMVLFFIVVGIFFIGGIDLKILGGGLLSLIIVIIIVWNSGLIQPYQKNRLTSFMNPEADSSESGYQLRQSLISIGNGGVVGLKGEVGKDKSNGYASQYVPEVQTDFIFASIAEQWGLAGAAFLLTLYGILISKMIAIGRTAKDTFGSIICVGLVAYFLFALLQNIGMTIGLMPITGITLPLISYGGSSLLTTVLSIGLILNIGMRRKKIYF